MGAVPVGVCGARRAAARAHREGARGGHVHAGEGPALEGGVGRADAGVQHVHVHPHAPSPDHVRIDVLDAPRVRLSCGDSRGCLVDGVRDSCLVGVLFDCLNKPWVELLDLLHHRREFSFSQVPLHKWHLTNVRIGRHCRRMELLDNALQHIARSTFLHHEHPRRRLILSGLRFTIDRTAVIRRTAVYTHAGMREELPPKIILRRCRSRPHLHQLEVS
mmetsp:Transcript_105756/g.279241  ORF Transcript_105756/g.279241 Transcript_105756/m.279241 type:complete len:218 (+) Transcript_105756:1460-2113(+)